MSPIEYFEVFVTGNYEDFKENEWCTRRAFNASVSAFQMADHYYYFCKRHDPDKVSRYNNKGEYFEYLYNLCPSFMDIRSIANAYKHLYTNGRNAVVASTGAIETVAIATSNVTEMFTEYEGSDEFVAYEKRTGEQIRLLSSLNHVMAMWQKEIYRS